MIYYYFLFITLRRFRVQPKLGDLKERTRTEDDELICSIDDV